MGNKWVSYFATKHSNLFFPFFGHKIQSVKWWDHSNLLAWSLIKPFFIALTLSESTEFIFVYLLIFLFSSKIWTLGKLGLSVLFTMVSQHAHKKVPTHSRCSINICWMMHQNHHSGENKHEYSVPAYFLLHFGFFKTFLFIYYFTTIYPKLSTLKEQ